MVAIGTGVSVTGTPDDSTWQERGTPDEKSKSASGDLDASSGSAVVVVSEEMASLRSPGGSLISDERELVIKPVEKVPSNIGILLMFCTTARQGE